MAAEKAWERIYGVGKFAGKAPQGSAVLRQGLEKRHANNPEFQGFLQKHNLNVGMSVAQAGKKQVVDKEVAAERERQSNKAYGATRGAKVGGEHGSSDEYRDTTVPLTPEQHSKVKAAAAAAKKAEATKVASKPTKSSSKLRGAALFNYLLDLESPKPTQQVKAQRASNLRSLAPDQNNYGETYNDDAHQDMSDLHQSLHIPLGSSNMDEEVEQVDEGMVVMHGLPFTDDEIKRLAAANKKDTPMKSRNPLHTTAHGLMRTASKLKAGSPEREAVTNALKNVVGAIKEAKGDWAKFANREAGKKPSWSDEIDAEQENQQPTIIKDKKGNPIGEVGVDPSGSLGVGPYYIKHYASGKSLSGYDSHEEAASELKHYAKLDEAGIQGGIGDVDYVPSWVRNTAPQNCATCHGRKSLWATPQGETFADRRTEDSTQINCPDCEGRGWVREEVEQLDEKYDKTSAAHLAAKRAARGMRSYIKPVFHPDGSATLLIHGDKDLSSTEVVDGHYRENDLGYNRPRKDYKRFSRTKDGLKYATKETGPNSHEMRITATTTTMREEYMKEENDFGSYKVVPHSSISKKFGVQPKTFAINPNRDGTGPDLSHDYIQHMSAKIYAQQINRHSDSPRTDAKIVKVGRKQKKVARVTTGKFGGNDRYSNAVFIDGKPAWTGLHDDEVSHYMDQAINSINQRQQRVRMTGSSGEAEEGNYLNRKITEARQEIINKLAAKMGKK